jgi:hypothetical protein
LVPPVRNDSDDEGSLEGGVDATARTKSQTSEDVSEIWPHWSEGVPTKLRLKVYDRQLCQEYYETLELKWHGKRLLSSLRGRSNSRLPSNKYGSQWSGVYRIFLPDTSIDRFCGKDPTGTLYVGLAGTGVLNRSILNTRIRSIIKNEHHATKGWRNIDVIRKKYPWDALAVEWAFTQVRLNSKRKNVGPTQAEKWLLHCYNDSFGEFPPLNQKG